MHQYFARVDRPKNFSLRKTELTLDSSGSRVIPRGMYAILRSARRQGVLNARHCDAWGAEVGWICVSDVAWWALRRVAPQHEGRHASTSLSESGVTKREGEGRKGREGRRKSSVNREEAAKFAKLSASWWDPNGPFKPLHGMNRARCEFIKGVIDNYVDETGCGRRGGNDGGSLEAASDRKELRVLDVGCGGGILSESLATMLMRDPGLDVRVIGIDVNQEGIDTATAHRDAAQPSLPAGRLVYRVAAIEDLLEDTPSEKFDITIASEVIEHVDHPEEFCLNLLRATKPGGRIVISTLNRTIKSYGLAIVAAETLLRMVPEGTHDWSRFLTPAEVVLMMTGGSDGGDRGDGGSQSASVESMAGMVLNPLTGLWRLDGDDVDVNYIINFVRSSSSPPLSQS